MAYVLLADILINFSLVIFTEFLLSYIQSVFSLRNRRGIYTPPPPSLWWHGHAHLMSEVTGAPPADHLVSSPLIPHP